MPPKKTSKSAKKRKEKGKVSLNQINKMMENKRFAFSNRRRFSPIQEKGAHPKNWSKFKFLPVWTPKGLVGFMGFSEQAPGQSFRGILRPKNLK